MDPLENISDELLSSDGHVTRVVDDYEIVAWLARKRRVSVDVSDRTDRIPRTLSLRTSRGARRTRLGAPAFDRALELSAPEPWALAVFGQSTRRLVKVMVERWGAVVESGTIRLSYAGAGVLPRAEILRTVRAALELARSLSIAPDAIPPALTENARSDPEPHLRERALRALVAEYPEPAVEACRRALTDPEPAVRLIAALSLEVDPTVEATLAELATAWSIAPEIRIDAFERFLEVAAGDAMPVLERALADPVLAERAVHATVRFADPGWTDFLAEVAGDCDDRLRTAIALVLADLGHPKAEVLLLSVPPSSATVVRLAELGSARAIPLLRRVASREARDAIARIRARVGELDGHLAIVGGEQDARGALSEAEAGKISINPGAVSDPRDRRD